MAKKKEVTEKKLSDWLDKKPEFKKECVLITANRYIDDAEWEYAIWQIKRCEDENDNGDATWYWGLLNGDGEEWGALEDLHAKKYLIITEP